MFDKANNNFYKMLNLRRQKYIDTVNKYPLQQENLKGWLNRIDNLEKEADNMIKEKFYTPQYADQITPFDKNYKGYLKNVSDQYTPERNEKLKNKYLYLINKQGKPTGQAAPIENKQPFTRQQIGAMSSDEFTKNEPMIMEQLKNGQIKDNMFNLDNLNNSRIFTREDIAGMTSNEYSKQEPQIMEQWKSIGIPTNNEMQNNSGAVYIQPYTKSDGTEVKGYYRKR